MSTLRTIILSALSLILICQAHDALAQITNYCVGDSLSLVNALNSAHNSAGTAVIRIQQSATVYNLKDSLLKCSNQTYGCGTDEPIYFNGLKLLGGYTDGSCSNRVLDSSKTILDGGGEYQGISTIADMRVEGLTFKSFKGFSFQLAQQSTSGPTVSVLNNIFSGAKVGLNTLLPSEQNLRFLNNLIDGQGLTVVAYDNTDQVTITGNTVVNAPSPYRGMDLCLYGGLADVTNNIVWNNASGDIFAVDYGANPEACGSAVATGHVKLSHNIYQAFSGVTAAGSGNNSLSDPQFVGGGDYHLQSTSPAINAGDISDPGVTSTDLDGNPRIVGSAPDIGAYESGVDDTTGTTILVTNANDSGAGSLRQAIINANASGGTHYVEFSMSSGSCPWVISLNSDLPYVSTSVLSINGFTQTGSHKNNAQGFGSAYGDSAIRCIVLNGEGRSQSMGLVFYGASSGFYWVQGLAFEGWGTALNMSAGQNNLVWGNQFGGSLVSPGANPDLPLSPNGIDIWLSGGTTTTTVGGSDPTDRNIIASAGASGSPQSPDAANYQGRGIAISAGGGSGGNSIINNLIGMDAYESTTTNGNAIGIQLETSGNTVADNVIGNNNNGIQALGSGANHNSIVDNRIGITEQFLVLCSPPPGGCPPDHSPTPNQAAIYFWQGANTNYVIGNTITNNTLYGIELIDSGTYRNEIAANSIYGNPASWASNGAEINLDGYSYGNNLPTNTPNRELNYPLIDGVVGSSSVGTINGRLESINGAYAIEVFSSPTCEAGGVYAHNPIGASTISDAFSDPIHGIYINGSGSFSFNFTSAFSLTGRYITATAIDGYGNTSEFSACKLYQCDVIFRHGFEGSTGEHCP